MIASAWRWAANEIQTKKIFPKSSFLRLSIIFFHYLSIGEFFFFSRIIYKQTFDYTSKYSKGEGHEMKQLDGFSLDLLSHKGCGGLGQLCEILKRMM